MTTFIPTTEEIRVYNKENECGLQKAKETLIKTKMIEHLQTGGASEPVLLFMLKEWLDV